MKNPIGKTLKRGLIVGIVFLFFSTVCLPVVAIEELPDLIVEKFYMEFWPDDWDGYWWVMAKIKNIGNASTIEWVEHTYTVTRLCFGFFVLSGTRNIGVIEPGQVRNTNLFCKNKIYLGFIEIKDTVNPERLIEESNYDNNILSQKYFVFFGHWKPIE
jgi:hypothetical protein